MLISPETINKIAEEANNNIDNVFDALGLDIDSCVGFSNEIRCPCPIHGGDNLTAFCYNTDFKRWRCYTGRCHEDTYGTIFDLVRKILNKKSEEDIGFLGSVRWLAKLLDIETEQSDNRIIVPQDKEVKQFIRQAKIKKNLAARQVDSIDADKFKPFPVSILDNKIKLSQYFLDKGFSESTLRKYNVGFCDSIDKPMYMRSYTPVLDETGDMVLGVTGRTVYEKCEFCPEFHKQGQGCPKDNPAIKGCPKWLHYGFKKNYVFYNYCFAKKSILESKVAILVEGPKDVWWLSQHGIENSLALFGLGLSDFQLKSLVKLGVMKILLCLDNDKYGLDSSEKLDTMLGEYFDITSMGHLLDYGQDIADLSTQKMNEVVKPFVQGTMNV